jgi:hypothetical protein
MLTAEEVRQALTYNPLNGEFTWNHNPARSRQWNGQFAGRRAGNLRDGYRRIKIQGRTYTASRLAWLHVHGQWPKHEIDHINRARDDDRIANLREATRSENQQNAGTRADNTCGYRGVYWSKHRNRWMAVINLPSKRLWLGHFDTPAKAHEAYQHAARQHFGEFANTGESA